MTHVVLVSGGVDSSVALLRTVDQYGAQDVVAYYLKIFAHEEERDALGIDCTSDEDLGYVERTCNQLGVRMEVLSLQRQYYEAVLQECLSDVQLGLTPNPDILCNSRMKYGVALSIIREREPDVVSVATGHYAQVRRVGDQTLLCRAADVVKDQTYFLSGLTQEQLRWATYPIGDLEKFEVRTLADQVNLPAAERPESQGLCFLGKFSWRDFLHYHVGDMPGEIRDRETGQQLGEHRGLHYYTYGQRKGIGLGGGPWFVVDKDECSKVLYVARELPQKSGRVDLVLGGLNWITDTPEVNREYLAKVRHTPEMTRLTVLSLDDKSCHVQLSVPDRGLAPGQSVVLYRDDICLGRGVILPFAH